MAQLPPLLVTNALPYANGSLHLGHLVEHVQCDIYVRFQRLLGRDVIYVCAADTHGTPIEVNARKKGLEPAVMVEQYRQEHIRDCKDFDISYDIYYTTNSPENQAYCERVYAALVAGGHVAEKDVEQFFCETDQRFLSDRFVKGTCPFCGTRDQYGDVCESCKKTYRPVELKAPYCVLCGNGPIRKPTTQLFVKLSAFADFLRDFSARLQPEVRNYIQHWMKEGLKDWEISRDGPYFGFPIPGKPNKYFYVWVDAPIGYISAAKHLAVERGFDLARYWPGTTDRPAESDSAEIVHFIGKDIIYFHTLFWPAMLKAAGFAVPAKIHVHGMLNFGGEKISKSRNPGHMITERRWLESFDPSYLRYYLAANLGPALDDIEFSLDELRNRVNSQLLNNVGNLANRALSFVATRFEGKLAAPTRPSDEISELLSGRVTQAKQAFADVNYREAIKQIEALASWANEFMQSAEPWKVIKTDRDRAQADVSLVVNVTKVLATMLSPVVPRFAKSLLTQINAPAELWDAGVTFNLPAGHSIGTPSPLLPPLEQAQLEALFPVAVSAEAVEKDKLQSKGPKALEEVPPGLPAAVAPEQAPPEPTMESIAPEITFDEFAKTDLRVGVIRTAERIRKAEKVLKLTVDLGEGTPRTIAAGIAKAYTPEELIGRRVVVVANLAPRTIFGVESRGMLLAANGGPKGLLLADIPGESAPGTRVK